MINPELQPFLAQWAESWSALPAGAGPAQRRAHFEVVAAEMRMPTPEGVQTEVVLVPGRVDKRAVRVRIFRPASAGPHPVLIYMHGGAWMQGSPETHWDITSRFAANCDHVVVSVDYALAPEHPFPAAVHDCQAVIEWAFEQADALHLVRDAIAVGGDSAGGNLAAAMTLIYRDAPQRLNAQLLIYPGVDFSLDRPSHRENADGPIINVASMSHMNAMYCPDPRDLSNPLAAPLRAEHHDRLPPAFIAVAEHDPLRDEGLAYAETLQHASVPVDVDHGRGLIHGYLRAMAYCADSRTAFARMCRWLQTVNAARSR